MTVDFDMDVTVNADTAFDIDPADGFAVPSSERLRPRRQLALGLASWVDAVHVNEEVLS